MAINAAVLGAELRAEVECSPALYSAVGCEAVAAALSPNPSNCSKYRNYSNYSNYSKAALSPNPTAESAALILTRRLPK